MRVSAVNAVILWIIQAKYISFMVLHYQRLFFSNWRICRTLLPKGEVPQPLSITATGGKDKQIPLSCRSQLLLLHSWPHPPPYKQWCILRGNLSVPWSFLHRLFRSVILAFYKLFSKISLISSLSGTLYPPSMISVLSTIPGSISSVTPIYHCSIKVISRGKGKSAVAAAAYRAGEKITNQFDGMTHDYTHKGGVVHTEILLPDHAPAAFSDRAVLWNEVEKIEKAKNALFQV